MGGGTVDNDNKNETFQWLKWFLIMKSSSTRLFGRSDAIILAACSFARGFMNLKSSFDCITDHPVLLLYSGVAQIKRERERERDKINLCIAKCFLLLLA